MAVKVNIGEKTTHTHPRLMKLRTDTDVVIFATERGAMFLSGGSAGQYLPSSGVDWEKFDDLVGSVTLHNAD